MTHRRLRRCLDPADRGRLSSVDSGREKTGTTSGQTSIGEALGEMNPDGLSSGVTGNAGRPDAS